MKYYPSKIESSWVMEWLYWWKSYVYLFCIFISDIFWNMTTLAVHSHSHDFMTYTLDIKVWMLMQCIKCIFGECVGEVYCIGNIQCEPVDTLTPVCVYNYVYLVHLILLLSPSSFMMCAYNDRHWPAYWASLLWYVELISLLLFLLTIKERKINIRLCLYCIQW